MPVGPGWTRAGTNTYKSTPGRLEVPPAPGEEWIAVEVEKKLDEFDIEVTSRN